jgi:small subunit ribosomal protein S21
MAPLEANQRPVLGICRRRWIFNLNVAFEWGWIRVAEVVIQEGESLENALRRFKRKVQSEDIIKEIKKHSYYMKPGEKRRAKAALSRKRLRKKQRREQD